MWLDAFKLVPYDLNGIIPTLMGRLEQQQALNLSGNNLQGSISYNLCHLKVFYFLSLGENKFLGQIPQCLVTLISPREL